MHSCTTTTSYCDCVNIECIKSLKILLCVGTWKIFSFCSAVVTFTIALLLPLPLLRTDSD